MAEAAVATVINKVVEIAGNAILEVGSRVYNLQEDVSWIESKMRALQSYLKDAESKKSGSHEVANLIINIRDLAHDVEDILDTYLPEIERHKTKGPFHLVKHASCIMCYGATANSFGLEIEKIKKRAADLEVSRTNCGITADANNRANDDDASVLDSRKLFLYAQESKIFGRQETLQRLEDEMLSGEKRCRIMSVVGPGGVGKTTVAKRIYHKLKNEFEICAIVYVSQEPKVGEILLDIAKQIGLNVDEFKKNVEDNSMQAEKLYLFLQEKLPLYLQERRYIVLLDDVWNTGIWDLLRDILVTNSENGSRMIVTSRYDDVCRYISGESSLIRLNFLSENEGKELFFNLMLPTSKEAPLTPILKDIGEKVVERCGGLPLAIVVAVGMLRARERSMHAWKQVLESMSTGGDENDYLKVLALSYHDLPTELKPLFLYFGIFPEDHEIFVSELIRFWLAEKLVQVDGSRKPNNIVEANIDKLIARNLIQVSKKRSDGRIKSCRIHDLLHDLCVQVAEGSNFFCTWNNLPSSGFASIVRRVTSNSSSLNEHHRLQNQLRVPGKLRALICFSEDKEVFKFIKTSALDLKFLRFLIIEIFSDNRQEVRLPNEIGKLSSLIHLRLCGNLDIPSSIGNLKKLVTLQVMGPEFRSIETPTSILQMKHLKHLILSEVIIDVSFLNRLTRVKVALPNLEILDFSKTYIREDTLLKYLLSPSTRTFCQNKFAKLFFNRASAFQNLESLKMIIYDVPRLDLSRYQSLVKLHLELDLDRGKIDIKSRIEFPPNLVKITFKSIKFQEDSPMESLKRLSRLEMLKLKNCAADNLDFSGENNFPQLQVLLLKEVNFNNLIADERGMPKLCMMVYKPPDQQLQIIPDRLKKLMNNIEE